MQEGVEPEYDWEHVLHCMDALLKDVWCNADDLPWYHLPPQPARKNYAEYQTRQCKDWSKVLEFTRVHNACFQYYNVTDFDGNEVDDQSFFFYQYCPEGSPYKSTMERYLRGIKTPS